MRTATHPATTDQLLAMLIEKVSTLEELLTGKRSDSDWLTVEQVEKEFGYKADTIRKMRYDGTITKYKCSQGRRKFRYYRKELQNILSLRIA